MQLQLVNTERLTYPLGVLRSNNTGKHVTIDWTIANFSCFDGLFLLLKQTTEFSIAFSQHHITEKLI